jgi:hypothetical protein
MIEQNKKNLVFVSSLKFKIDQTKAIIPIVPT